PGSARWGWCPPTWSSRRSWPPPSTAGPWSRWGGTRRRGHGGRRRWGGAGALAGDHEDWAFVNVTVRPYYAEGSKTLGFEVAERLGWRLPEQVVIPVASGSQLTKVDKGFTELGTLGLVEATPYRVFGAQATGCSPVAQ